MMWVFVVNVTISLQIYFVCACLGTLKTNSSHMFVVFATEFACREHAIQMT